MTPSSNEVAEISEFLSHLTLKSPAEKKAFFKYRIVLCMYMYMYLYKYNVSFVSSPQLSG